MSVRREGTSGAQSRSRRGLLCTVAGGVVGSLAGCSRLLDAVEEQFLEDVTVLNNSEWTMTADLAVTGPDGRVLVDDSREILSEETFDESEGSSQNFAHYADVLETTGDYAIGIDVAYAVEASESAEETVSVSDPEEQTIAVVFAPESIDPPIAIDVIESMRDLQQYNQTAQ